MLFVMSFADPVVAKASTRKLGLARAVDPTRAVLLRAWRPNEIDGHDGRRAAPGSDALIVMKIL